MKTVLQPLDLIMGHSLVAFYLTLHPRPLKAELVLSSVYSVMLKDTTQ